jgi:hypothetical protein
LLCRDFEILTEIENVKTFEKNVEFTELGFNDHLKWSVELLQLYEDRFDFSLLATKYKHKRVQDKLWKDIYSEWLNDGLVDSILEKIVEKGNLDNW